MSNLDFKKSYHDLCKEIEVWEIRLWELKRQMERITKQMITPPRTKLNASYSDMPPGGGFHLHFPAAWEEIRAIESCILEAEDVLDLKREAKRRMEKAMSEFEGLEYRVAYMRDIERKPLTQIARELGYSYDWIREKSAKIKRQKPTINPQSA